MKLTLDPAWLLRDYEPETLTSSPFPELPATPPFPDVVEAELPERQTEQSLSGFASDLTWAVGEALIDIDGPIDCLLSGGYDSRMIATILELRGRQPRYITDGEEEPTCTHTLDYLGVPESRRYVHDLNQPDPYGLVDASCEGWAPLYFQMRFMPPDTEGRTLVCGLGGGEWFSYPAAGWHTAKPRVPHSSLRNMWADTWPQYWLIPDSWARGYEELVCPYATVGYAKVANMCRQEWLVELDPKRALDMVRKAMLDHLDTRLARLGWEPHAYRWMLTADELEQIDARFRSSWLAQRFDLGRLRPSLMHHDVYACRLGGFATWCDLLLADGHEIVVAS
jgi:hypothetical protein